MFGFFKKKEVAPPPIREEVTIPKEHVKEFLKLYGDATLYCSLPSFGLQHKYDLWSYVDRKVGKEIEAAKAKHPNVEKFSLSICVEDVLNPKIIITKSK
jgi:hypothetical protein